MGQELDVLTSIWEHLLDEPHGRHCQCAEAHDQYHDHLSLAVPPRLGWPCFDRWQQPEGTAPLSLYLYSEIL